MTRSIKQRQQKDAAGQRQRAEEQGDHFAVLWTMNGYSYGPRYFRTLEEATALRDDMLRENEREIPNDWYERQGYVKKLSAYLQAFDGGTWSTVPDSHETVVCDAVSID